MTKKMDLKMSLNGADNLKLLRALTLLEPFNKKKPTIVSVNDFDWYEGSSDWIDKWIPKSKHGLTACWGNWRIGEYEEGFLHIHPRFNIVKLRIGDYPRDPQALLAMLESLPWTQVTFGSIYSSWYDYDSKEYPHIRFADMHHPLSWGCAFKGLGHRELVSRRWLEFGPWHLLKGANDTSFVQFHDLEADCETALEQAKIGHQRMGFTTTGGIIPSKSSFRHPIKGLYTFEERKLEIVTIERKISQSEMLDCCAARYHQALGEDKPLDTLAYVFMKEDEAREHLHELWLREIECWTFINGSRTRIDTDYHPIPQKPDWVRKLEDKEEL